MAADKQTPTNKWNLVLYGQVMQLYTADHELSLLVLYHSMNFAMTQKYETHNTDLTYTLMDQVTIIILAAPQSLPQHQHP